MFACGNEAVPIHFINILYSYIIFPDPPQFGDS